MKNVGTIIVVSLLLSQGMFAAEFFQTESMSAKRGWHEAFWVQEGGVETIPVPGNTYVNAVEDGRTRTEGGITAIFAGDSLELRAKGAILALKSRRMTVNLIMNTGTEISNFGVADTLKGTITTLGNGSIMFSAGADGRHTKIESRMDMGSGIETISIDCGDEDASNGPRQSGYTISNGDNTFSGTWEVLQGYLVGKVNGALGESSFLVGNEGLLDFEYNFINPAGRLVVEEHGILDLDQSLTFGSVFIWGIKIENGTYSVRDLIQQFGVNAGAFEDGEKSTGTITIVSEIKELG